MEKRVARMAKGSHGAIERAPGLLFRAMGFLLLQKKDCTREALAQELKEHLETVGVRLPRPNAQAAAHGERVLDEEMKPNTTCRRPFHTLVLTWEGQSVICCVDYKREVKLGNVHEQSIYEIWNGPWATQLRKEYLSQEFGNLPTCAKCTINSD